MGRGEIDGLRSGRRVLGRLEEVSVLRGSAIWQLLARSGAPRSVQSAPWMSSATGMGPPLELSVLRPVRCAFAVSTDRIYVGIPSV